MCFGFNTSFQRRIIEAWTKGTDARIVTQIPVSGHGRLNAEKHVDIAMQSARHLLAGRFGRRVKRLFLKAQFNWLCDYLEKHEPKQVLIYNGFNGVNYLVRAACEELGLTTLYFERAPFQDRIQIDAKGVNFQSSVPNQASFYQTFQRGELSDWQPAATYTARADLEISSPGSARGTPAALGTSRFLFCPLQVPRDTQVTVFGGWIDDMPHLLDCLNEASTRLPSGMHVRVKEHPASPVSLKEHVEKFNNPRLILDNESDTGALIENAEGVVTVNSSVGLEAFLFNKPVITLGQALYSFGDLTTKADTVAELCHVMKHFEDISFSQDNRERFIEFLYFWFPSLKAVQDGDYTRRELQERDEKLRLLLEKAGSESD